MKPPSGATSSCGASSPTGMSKPSNRASRWMRHRGPRRPERPPTPRPSQHTPCSPIASTPRSACCTQWCRSSPRSCGRSCRGGNRTNCWRPRPGRRQTVVRRAGGRDRPASGVPAPPGRAHAARAPAGGPRRQAHQQEFHRAGARWGGRQGARKGAGVARPAAGAGRQAQVAGLLLTALLGGGACASQGDPPGGPPRTTAPAILRTIPESGAVTPDLHGDAVVQFDEVIDEMPSRGGAAGAISGLAQKVVLSPVGSDVKVSWHRSSIHVSPQEGWKRGRVYHLQLLPGIADLRRNSTKTGTTIVFTTGPAVPAATLVGTVLLWADQRTLPQAVIRAALLPDTVAYITLTDSAGNFRLAAVPSGRYRVWAIQDENNNRRQDRREAFDTVTVTVDSTASALLWAFVHDTVGPRVRTVEPIDSLA